MAMRGKAASIDEYLAGVPEDKRAALEKLRKAILAVVPSAEECFSYGIPGYSVDGNSVVGFAAAAKHCSYFPMSGSVIATLKADLKNYDTSKGAIRFPADKPLPAALVRKLLKARLAEIAGKGKKKDR